MKSNLNQIDSVLKQEVEMEKTPSVEYLLFNKDKIIHKFKTGFTDIKNQKTASDNTTFHAFSVTKTFTALAVMQLAENKKLELDESVKKYLPKFPYGSEISIRNLLTHTAGIPNPNPLAWIHLEEEHTSFNANLFFDRVFRKHNRTKSKPNEKFRYSNLGYVLLGQLIEEVSGEDYRKYTQKHILNPLGLNSKELGFEIVDEGNLAKGYQKRTSLMNLLLGFFINKSKFMAKTEGKWQPFKNYHLNGASYGGLVGTPIAFVKYVQELLRPNCLLLSDEFKKILFTENHTNNGKATGICLSWFTGKLNNITYYTHAGGGGGYYCEVRIYPEIEIGSVVMFNRSGIRDERFLDKLDVHYLPLIK